MTRPLWFTNHALDAAGGSRAWSCTACGALVSSKQLHTRWHREHDEAKADAVRWAGVALADVSRIPADEHEDDCPQCDDAHRTIARWSP